MQTEETHSWKEKIDPAFDEYIKVNLDFIKKTCICDHHCLESLRDGIQVLEFSYNLVTVEEKQEV